MIDPDDKNTRKLDLPEPVEPATRATSNIISIVEPRLEERALELGLVRERRPVFVLDPKEAKERGGSADRMAKLRNKQAAAGLRPAAVPVALLAEVKEAGGWEAWQAKQTAPPVQEPTIVEVPGPERVIIQTVEVPGPERILEKKVEVRVEVPGPERLITVEKTVEVHAKVEQRDWDAMLLGRKVRALKGWRATVVRWLLQ